MSASSPVGRHTFEIRGGVVTLWHCPVRAG
jgi:hypothetical protein